MSLASSKLRAPVAVSTNPVLRPARACRVTTSCGVPQGSDGHLSRRQSLGLLAGLPMLLSLKPANAVDIGDFRKVKGRSNA